MINFTHINASSNIGDSLATINDNYKNLDIWTNNIQASAQYLWQPMLDLYLNHQVDWSESVTLIQTNSAKWIDVSTTVEYCSARWIKPLTLFYPYIYKSDTTVSSIKSTIDTWLNQNFPVTVEYLSRPNYIENQVAIVYNYHYYIAKTINETATLIDQTQCQTRDYVAMATCKTFLLGTAFCSNGDMTCDGQVLDCSNSQYVECYYNPPPAGPYILPGTLKSKIVYVEQEPLKQIDEDGNVTTTPVDPIAVEEFGIDNSSGTGYINANVRFQFTDRAETSSLNAFKFIVKDCKWVFDTMI
jgi:hypothetical protein